jgi:hypothetical protein
MATRTTPPATPPAIAAMGLEAGLPLFSLLGRTPAASPDGDSEPVVKVVVVVVGWAGAAMNPGGFPVTLVTSKFVGIGPAMDGDVIWVSMADGWSFLPEPSSVNATEGMFVKLEGCSAGGVSCIREMPGMELLGAVGGGGGVVSGAVEVVIVVVDGCTGGGGDGGILADVTTAEVSAGGGGGGGGGGLGVGVGVGAAEVSSVGIGVGAVEVSSDGSGAAFTGGGCCGRRSGGGGGDDDGGGC